MTRPAAGGRPAARLVVRYGVVPAHELLRSEAARFLGVPVADVELAHACPRCGSREHGRPSVRAAASLGTPVHVSLSRAGALSVVAITDAGPVGVDVESGGAADFDGFDDVARYVDPLLEPRVDAGVLWARKEALLKACGLGLVVDPRHVALDDGVIAAWDSPHPRPDAALIRDLDVAGFVAAVAVLTADESLLISLGSE